MTELERILKYKFQDKELLSLALTHKSYDTQCNNEILEFLGDAIVNYAVVRYIVFHHKSATLKTMALMKSNLIKHTTLSEIGSNLTLYQYLKCRLDANKGLTKVLEDAVEALVGAIYLDSGSIEQASGWIINLLPTNELHVIRKPSSRNLLQEYSQMQYKQKPMYERKQIGNIFYVRITMPDKRQFFGKGTSIKEAKNKADADAITYYKIN